MTVGLQQEGREGECILWRLVLEYLAGEVRRAGAVGDSACRHVRCRRKGDCDAPSVAVEAGGEAVMMLCGKPG